MALPPESRSWFERGIFDLAIAQAHVQSGLWMPAAQHARQAALKFMQAALVAKGERDPSPRMAALVTATSSRFPQFTPRPEWNAFDRFASEETVPEADGRAAFRWAEEIRDAVAKLLA
jgi:hypothetical protein